MPLLQSGHQGRCNSSSEFLRYTVPNCCCNVDVEASQFKCVLSIPDIPDRRYCLRSPMLIEVEKEDSGYVISQPDTGVFVYDADLEVALNQFYEAFVEQYEFLESNIQQLSPSLKRDLQTFESFLKLY